VESITLTDSQTATAVHVGNRTESVTLTHSQTGVDAIQSRTRAETVTFTAQQAGFVPGVGIIGKVGGDDVPRQKPRRSTNQIREEEAIIEILAMLVLEEELTS
jgi:hypothetical protein